MSRTLDFLLGALMATAAFAFALVLVITGTHKPHLAHHLGNKGRSTRNQLTEVIHKDSMLHLG